ncbi:hypothetical protein LOD99_9926 [Oopsacas minuta]|uniref:Uncharacterized protein n=1 Tax=Oopsacas minuta TaxID=111878 RepID=A0AAV7KQW7_9METZ|nr:hypothetical protein LOD99_9926 [Oopsacas minuta]
MTSLRHDTVGPKFSNLRLPDTSPSIYGVYALSSHNENTLVSAKHFDSDDIVDTQTHLKIDGQTKIRSIKATLKKCPIPKYLPDRDYRSKQLNSALMDMKKSRGNSSSLVDVFEEEQRKFIVSS